jgi:hypothetical protein
LIGTLTPFVCPGSATLIVHRNPLLTALTFSVFEGRGATFHRVEVTGNDALQTIDNLRLRTNAGTPVSLLFGLLPVSPAMVVPLAS